MSTFTLEININYIHNNQINLKYNFNVSFFLAWNKIKGIKSRYKKTCPKIN